MEQTIKNDLQANVNAAMDRFAKAQSEHEKSPGDLLLLRLDLARTELSAARAEIIRMQTHLSAEKARLRSTAQVNRGAIYETGDLVRLAVDANEEALLRKIETNVLAARVAVAQSEALPADSPDRAAKIQSAQSQLNDAQQKKSQFVSQSTKPEEPQKLTPIYPQISSGRRTALANWITHQANPLVARVAVNHIWLRHFQSPLIATMFDFGRNGAQPTHPELLDWLAVELQETNWSMKQLHRLMVTSTAYQRSSGGHAFAETIAENQRRDSENRTLWRANTGRMESEVVRDALLYCSQQLDGAMGGQELENSEALSTHRRTLYYSCQPENDGASEFGRLFDAPDPSQCYRRTRSIVPQQSLALTNSDFMHKLSENMAARLSGGVSSSQSFIESIFRRIVARGPTIEEQAACRKFLEEASGEGTSLARRAGLIRVLLNHNDFITVR